MEGLAEALERSTGEKLSKYEELLKANSPTKLVISIMYIMLPLHSRSLAEGTNVEL